MSPSHSKPTFAAPQAKRTGSRGPVGLGPALRRAWAGYQQQLDEAMARAGFGDRGLPDGRVLRLCAASEGTTVARIGRELGITRQGASKIVWDLEDRGYVAVAASPSNGRENVVTATRRGHAFLAAQRKAARAIERRVRARVGPEGLAALEQLLEHLGADEDLRLRGYLRKMRVRET